MAVTPRGQDLFSPSGQFAASPTIGEVPRPGGRPFLLSLGTLFTATSFVWAAPPSTPVVTDDGVYTTSKDPASCHLEQFRFGDRDSGVSILDYLNRCVLQPEAG